MLASHYAPSARVVLAESRDEAMHLAADLEHVELIDRTADLVDYAQHLYADLRDADARGTGIIVAVLPSAEGLGHAIRDRLMKAASPR
jgi:L-threonylcarbamoyladenylate synthase